MHWGPHGHVVRGHGFSGAEGPRGSWSSLDPDACEALLKKGSVHRAALSALRGRKPPPPPPPPQPPTPRGRERPLGAIFVFFCGSKKALWALTKNMLPWFSLDASSAPGHKTGPRAPDGPKVWTRCNGAPTTHVIIYIYIYSALPPAPCRPQVEIVLFITAVRYEHIFPYAPCTLRKPPQIVPRA